MHADFTASKVIENEELLKQKGDRLKHIPKEAFRMYDKHL